MGCNMCSISVECACAVLVSVILSSAAICDVRARMVPDVHWFSMSVIAVSMCLFRLDGALHIVTGVVAILLMSLYMLSDRLYGVIGGLTVSIPMVLWVFLYIDGEPPWVLVTPAMYVLSLLFYHLGLLRGGADAKVMMSVSMVSPFYPWVGMSLQPLLNPPLMVLTVASLLSMLYAVPILFRGIRSGRPSLSRYRMPLEEVGRSFVWPVEDIVDGELRRTRPSDDRDGVCGRLRDAGYDDVEVTPMIPFVLPIAVAYILVIPMGMAIPVWM